MAMSFVWFFRLVPMQWGPTQVIVLRGRAAVRSAHSPVTNTTLSNFHLDPYKFAGSRLHFQSQNPGIERPTITGFLHGLKKRA